MNKEGIKTFDSIQLAVLTSRFKGIVRSMANTLFRTGRSGVLNTAHDFSCCILTKEHEMVVAAESLPIHIMIGPDLMAKSMVKFHPKIKRGDAFLHNSPYHGNSHAADLSVLIPVIDSNGKHHFTVLAKAHMADIGNAKATTYMAAARDVYEEGALIFPAVKIQENYEFINDIVRMCRLRIRAPELFWGDFLALIGAARIGEKHLLELGDELGWNTLHEYTQQWFNYSESMMASAISQLPSGEVTTYSVHDPFPGVPNGIPIQVKVTVDSDEGIIEADLRENPDCMPCGLNQSEATVSTAVMIGVFDSFNSIIPANAGSFRRIKIRLRENCVVGIPRHPASCSVATTSLGNRVGNMVQRALAELAEGFGMAEVGAILPPSYAVISGCDPRKDGAPFVNELLLGCTGGAATPSNDGWLTTSDLGAAGMVYVDSIEMDELQYPIRVLSRRIITDSGGAGRFCGSPGVFVEYGPIDCTIELNYASDGCVNPAQGARGGMQGGVAKQYRRDISGNLEKLDPVGPIILKPGETVLSMSTGGGGYGLPIERETNSVKEDIIDGIITQERAKEIYGVVLDANLEIDVNATKSLRTK